LTLNARLIAGVVVLGLAFGASAAHRVRIVADVAYTDSGNAQHRLDLYLPAKRTRAPLPIVVFLFGGGWDGGDKAEGRQWLAPFIRSGAYAGVSIGYRLADEAKWPAQIHDIKAAVRWLKANARKYHLDGDRIALLGRSAGGHLAPVAALSQDTAELEGELGPHRRESSRVTAAINFFGVTDLLTMRPISTLPSPVSLRRS